jgi:hypothetical protein
MGDTQSASNMDGMSSSTDFELRINELEAPIQILIRRKKKLP